MSKLVDVFFQIVLNIKSYRLKLYEDAIHHQLRNSKFGKVALSRLNKFMSKHHYTHQEFMLVANSSNYQQAFWQSDLGFVWFNNSINNENQYFKFAIEQFATSQMNSVLDVGCGWGAFCASIVTLPNAKNVLGIDISEKIIAEAKQRHAHSNLKYEVNEIFNLKESFDLITVFGSIDYIHPEQITLFLDKLVSISKSHIFIVNSLRGISIEEAKNLQNSIEIKRYDIGYVQPLYHYFSNKEFKYFKFEKMGQDSQIIHIIK